MLEYADGERQMIGYTDSLQYAKEILAEDIAWSEAPQEYQNEELSVLASRLFSSDAIVHAASVPGQFWQYLFAVERTSDSQFDIVGDLCRQNVELPDGLLCSAGSGDFLHGQHDRPWVALPGNIHLTAYFAPNRSAAELGVGFSLLAAVSMIEAIDSIDCFAGKAGIKWVNDIVIDDAKIAGFITHTTIVESMVVAAVIGIGLNVEATPAITPDLFFHRAACLCDYIDKEQSPCSQRLVFSLLLKTLAENYKLLRTGQVSRLLDSYRARSIVVGREVEILPDSPHRADEAPVRGTITAIGDNLELYLDGRSEPVTRGRLSFIPEAS
jgi:biotin-[acetyl-CoA-carboxylase] ligase BirA-like protein